MKKIIIAALASTAFASGAFANAGPAAPAAAGCPSVSWAGGKLGAQVGMGHANVKSMHRTNPVGGAVAFDNIHGHLSSTGALGGLHADWDWQNGNWVYGLGAMFDFSGMNGTHKNIVRDAQGVVDEASTNAKMKWTVGLGARAGFAVNNSLFYGSAGWVGSKWQAKHTWFNTGAAAPNNRYSVSKSKFVSGLRLALGASQKMDRWIVGVEAGYSFYGKVSSTTRQLTNTLDVRTSIKPRVLDAKLKVAYHF